METSETIMTSIDRVKHVLDVIGWNYSFDAEANSLSVDLNEDGSPISSAFFAVTPSDSLLVLYLNYAVEAEPDTKERVAVAITRINWGLLYGNFEVDLTDGHFRYRASVDYTNTELTEDLVRNVIANAIRAVDEFALELKWLLNPNG